MFARQDLTLLSAAQAAEAIRTGTLTSEALVRAYIARIEATEAVVKAWAWFDPEAALLQAKEADRIRRAGHGTGALHGVPVGVKDIIDTRAMPTARGSSVFEGRQPDADARLIERLIEAGAVIMGKTKTTEMGFLHPTDTTNPHDTTRTPGGSSSGSAAAVAARHVPLAIGTQTGGSVIRPASFCGVYGFKPSRGTISRTGVLRTSATLDQIGCFANSLEDIALLSDVLGGYDQTDPASYPRPRPPMSKGAQSDAPVLPDIAWFDMPYHDRLDPDAREGLDAVIDALGPRVERFAPSAQLADLVNVHKTLYDYEIHQNLGHLNQDHAGALSSELQEALSRGAKVSEDQYTEALEVKTSAEAFFAKHFLDFDAIISPAASGEALPLTRGSTGDAVHCTTWTLAGLPCLTLPLLVGDNGLPIGVQLIGPIEKDDRLLRTAGWMQKALAEDTLDED